MAQPLERREFNFDDSCNEDKRGQLVIEFGNARLMAQEAKSINVDSVYYQSLISKFHQDMGEGFFTNIRDGFGRIEEMLKQFKGNYKMKVTCKNNTPLCKKSNYFAHINDEKRTMNFCDKFFDPKQGIKPTNDVIDNCGTVELRAAHRTRAAIIIHECTHTKFAMIDTSPALDISYGFNGCYQLANNAFNRACAPYKKDKPTDPSQVFCPNPDKLLEESWCVAELEMKNADTWAFLAAGTYFSAVCGREIPLPPLPELPSRPNSNIFTRADECVGFDDAIIIDGPNYGDDDKGVI